jgi:hypothetical protein
MPFRSQDIKTPTPTISEDELEVLFIYRQLPKDKQCEFKGYGKRMLHETEAAEAAKQIKDA